jgi:hypothetical protein
MKYKDNQIKVNEIDNKIYGSERGHENYLKTQIPIVARRGESTT